jgi:hypothetical protein
VIAAHQGVCRQSSVESRRQIVTSGSLWITEPESAVPFRKMLDLPSGVFLRGLTWTRDGSSLIVGRIQWMGDIFLAERSAMP